MDANTTSEALALLAALQDDIANRLRPVCAWMTADDFDRLVREIAAVKIKYGVESQGSASLRVELASLLNGQSRDNQQREA
jgi:hypothetical protein